MPIMTIAIVLSIFVMRFREVFSQKFRVIAICLDGSYLSYFHLSKGDSWTNGHIEPVGSFEVIVVRFVIQDCLMGV